MLLGLRTRKHCFILWSLIQKTFHLYFKINCSSTDFFPCMDGHYLFCGLTLFLPRMMDGLWWWWSLHSATVQLLYCFSTIDWIDNPLNNWLNSQPSSHHTRMPDQDCETSCNINSSDHKLWPHSCPFFGVFQFERYYITWSLNVCMYLLGSAAQVEFQYWWLDGDHWIESLSSTSINKKPFKIRQCK